MNLKDKNVALFGATGGIGKELARYILQLSGNLIMVNRSKEKSEQLKAQLSGEFPEGKISFLLMDLEDMESVKEGCETLREQGVDVLVHNAGAYSIPRKTCSTGLDNVFQINFVSPYYITNALLSHLEERGGRVIVVGSIAHNYSKTDETDVDFSTRKKASLVYGNAKRHLMFAISHLASEHGKVQFAITHPGITFTNITNHYPKWLFFIIKNPMKWIFMPPRKAALCIRQGFFESTGYHEWIGPALFDVWGRPRKRKLKTCSPEESKQIYERAKKILEDVSEREKG